MVALLVLVVQFAASAAEVSPPAPAVMIDVDAGHQTLALINAARTQQALAPLVWDDSLALAAQSHAELLVRNRQLSHQFPDEPALQQRISKVDARFGISGENVAVNYDAGGAHISFMNSPGHRANILNSEFDSVAIAVVRDGDLLYFVEDFAHRRPVLSNSDAAQALATRFAGLRTRTGTQPMQEFSDSRLQEWACEDAKADKLGTAKGAILGAQYAIAFSASELDTIPAGLAHLIETQIAVDRYSAGVCYAQTARYPNGRYFVALALYGSNGTPSRTSIATNLPVGSSIPGGIPEKAK